MGRSVRARARVRARGGAKGGPPCQADSALSCVETAGLEAAERRLEDDHEKYAWALPVLHVDNEGLEADERRLADRRTGNEGRAGSEGCSVSGRRGRPRAARRDSAPQTHRARTDGSVPCLLLNYHHHNHNND